MGNRVRLGWTARRWVAAFAVASTFVAVAVVTVAINDVLASQVGAVAVTISPSTAGQSSAYTVSFSVASRLPSSSGTLALNAAGSEAGTVFPAAVADYVITDLTHSSGSGTVTAAPTVANGGSKVTFAVPKTISAGDSLKVVVSGVVNPPLASATQAIAVNTSSDTTPVNSSAYAVSAAPSGSGALTVSPASVTAGTATSLALTYTAAAGGTVSGTIAATVPAGWSVPTTTPGTSGYTTVSTGTLSISGTTISISGVTLASNAALQIVYGAGGGSNAALSPSAVGTSTFMATESSTANGSPATLAISPAVAVTYAPDGSGSMSISPSAVTAGTPTTLVFTYTAAKGGMSAGATAITIPSSWTAPSTAPGTPGYATASAGTVTVSGQTITISGVTLPASAMMTVTYGAGGGAAAVSTSAAGPSTFATTQRSTGTGTLTPLGNSPSVSGLTAPDGSGTMTVSPAIALASSPTTLAFTYTAATGGMAAGTVAIDVPAGWTPPSITATTAGYTTSSAGLVAVSGQRISVSGVTLTAGTTLVVTYGAGGGSASATSPLATGAETFPAWESSLPVGTITSLSNSPAETLTASPDGAGSAAVSPSAVTASVPAALGFTYTSASGGVISGAVSLTVPSGWPSPTTTPSAAGFTTTSSGALSVAGQTVTVSGVTLASGSTLTINYGTGSTVIPPLGSDSASFAIAERSTGSGTFMALATAPAVTIHQWPANSTAPFTSGFTGNQLTLTAHNGTWLNGPTSFGYAWQRCDATASNCTTIAGATSSAYAIASTDTGSTLRVAVTGANSFGQTQATSAATAVVPAAGSCPVAGATDTWTGAAGTINWGDAANWSKSVAPTSTDFACLPIDTPGASSITVPSGSLKQLLSFKPLALPSGIATTNGADIEANASWTGGSFSGPSVVIGSGSAPTVTVSASVSLMGSLVLTNDSLMQLQDGAALTVGQGTAWLNYGTLAYADSIGVTVTVSGAFTNEPSGVVTKAGTATTDGVAWSGSWASLQNEGSVTSQQGVLNWSTRLASPVSDGSFAGTGAGHVDLTGYTVVSSQAMFGNNVWVPNGTLAGSIVVPSGTTLNIGGDPLDSYCWGGIVAGPVTGAGTLNVAGTNCYGVNPSWSMIAGDVSAATLQLGGAEFINKSDGSATVIGASTTVQVNGRVSVTDTVTLSNFGAVQLQNGSSLSTDAGTAVRNYGALTFADAAGATVTFGGTFVNQSSGVVTKSGTAAQDSLTWSGSVATMQNEGSITAQTGVLNWSTRLGSPASDGSFGGTGSGHLDVTGNAPVSSQAVFGNNVWVAGGTLSGAIMIPSGVTLNIGGDASDSYCWGGTIAGTVSGAGTLNVAGIYCYGLNPSYAVVMADLTAPALTVKLSGAQLSPKSDGTATQIGTTTTVVITGVVSLTSSVTLASYGTLQLQNGAALSSDAGTTIDNYGSLLLVDGSGVTASFAGSFVNQSSGVVTKSGTAAQDSLTWSGTSAIMQNEGAVSSQSGVLNWRSRLGSPPSDGGFGGGTGHVDITGYTVVSGQATFGNNVWIAGGTLAGTIVIPSGVTLNVGGDTTDSYCWGGTIAGVASGSGTLNVAGIYCYGLSPSYAVVAADLNSPGLTVILSGAQFTPKADGTSTVVVAGTTAQVTGTVSLASAVTLANHGRMQFQNGGSMAADAGTTMQNYGTLAFLDSAGVTASFGGGFVTEAGGAVTKTGSATADTVTSSGASALMQNEGSVSSQSGVLNWFSRAGSPTSDGSFGGGNGHVDITGYTTLSAQAVLANNVWVAGGTLAGLIVIPSGVTLNVGGDVTDSYCWGGTIAGAVSGSGTLNVAGVYCYGLSPSYAVIAADVNAPAVTVLLSGAQFVPKADGTATVLAAGTTARVSGQVSLAAPVSLANRGTFELDDGGSVVADAGTTLQNYGTLAFVDSNGVTATLSGGFVNEQGGVVSKTGTAVKDQVVNSGGSSVMQNEGSVTSQNGVLNWTSGARSPVSDGGFGGSGTGHVDLTGYTPVSGQATFGNNVWVAGGTLAGDITIPSGVTLTVGGDTSDSYCWGGTVAGSVSGDGTLSVAGVYCYGLNPSPGVVAADLNVRTATVNGGEFAVKADGTATVIGNTATVTLIATPVLDANLALDNYGTLDFHGVGYFTCTTCTMVNELGADLQVYNPDGNFTHSFTIGAGTFDAQGMIQLTGYMPGVPIEFGNVVLPNGKGHAEVDNLVQPTWIQNIKSNSTAQAVANSVASSGPGGIFSLARNTMMYVAAQVTKMGIAQCTNVNANIGVTGGSIGACVVVDSYGNESVLISVSTVTGASVENSSDWQLSDVFSGAGYDIDAGAQVLWNQGGDGQYFNLANGDGDGLSYCQTGRIVLLVGVVGQHCWGPGNLVPFDLDSWFQIAGPGIHSVYAGVSSGDGYGLSFGVSYSASITCAQWYSLTQQICPPTNITVPIISGTPAIGQVLTATSPGTWTAVGSNVTYGYQWMRCTTAVVTSCSQIGGATGTQYTVVSADKNDWLTAAVTATNVGGTSQPAEATTLGAVP